MARPTRPAIRSSETAMTTRQLGTVPTDSVLTGDLDEAAVRQAVTAHFAKLAPGEEVPKPSEPGSPQAGAVRELGRQNPPASGRARGLPGLQPPQPGSELYAPFLVLLARFWAASAQPGGGGGTVRPSVYFPLLEDPTVLGVSAMAKPGETAPRAIARLESFVADTIAPQLRDDERASARQTFALFLGTADIPDFALAQNPYGCGDLPGPARAFGDRLAQAQSCVRRPHRTGPPPRGRRTLHPGPPCWGVHFARQVRAPHVTRLRRVAIGM